MDEYAMVSKYVDYWKVVKIIDSCTSVNHLVVAEKVVDRFLKTYKDERLFIKLTYFLDVKERTFTKTY